MLLLSRPKIETLDETESRGSFLVGPLERGFGHTLGNSLRRTLLSSIPGVAVTQIQFDNAVHEFSVMEGIVEDVSEIILNLKDLVLKAPDDFVGCQIRVEEHGPTEITGSIIGQESGIEVMNPELHIATVNSGCTFSGYLTISRGRGYRQAGPAGAESTYGVIPIDAIFSPIRRVTFGVEETADGSDQLILHITTDETLSPSEAVASAASTLISLLGVVEAISEEYPQVQVQNIDEFITTGSQPDNRSIDELRLSERAQNCLRRAQINTIGELISRTPGDLRKITNFGDKSLKEVQDVLAKRNLSLVAGIEVSGLAGQGSSSGGDESDGTVGGSHSVDIDEGGSSSDSDPVDELNEEENYANRPN